MENFNNVPSSGTFGSVVSVVNQNFALAKEAIDKLAFSKSACMGFYETSQELNDAHPTPTDGDWALVGNSSPFNVYVANDGSWVDSGVNYNVSVDNSIEINGLGGYVVLDSVQELPASPSNPNLGYLIGTHLYVYVGTGGDTADGKYQDCCEFRGPKGNNGESIERIEKTSTSGLVDTYTITYTDGSTSTFTVTNGADGHDGVSLGEVAIVNNLTEGGSNKVLSAEMGKELKERIDTKTLSRFCIQLLKKILNSGVYIQNISADIDELIDNLVNGAGETNVVSPTISIDDYFISIINEDVDENAKMFYTVDGQTPTEQSAQYATPFKLQYDSIIKAIAYNSENASSRVSSIDYKAGPIEYIEFADVEVLEPLVLGLADMNSDGKITPAEAALVTNIGTTFKGKGITSFEELSFFTGITELKFQSFSGCSSLKTIRVPKNVTKIDNQSFQGCTNLELIYLPDGITTMCNCFAGGLSKLKIAGNRLPSSLNSFSGYYNDNLTFTGCSELELDELPPHLPKISPSMFKGCAKLALTSLPSEITSIGESSFEGCKLLAITEIPESVSGTLAASVFNGCSSLVRLVINGNITGITGNYTFQNCANLEEIIFPETMTTWSGLFTFNGCTKLKKIMLKSPSVVALSRANNDTIGANSNIYVPSSLVASYLADAKWSTITNASNRIKAIEE